jgi:23S rRNA (uracil1939-C5)-methyltransferase
LNVKIEKLVYGGDGLAHADGRTVFVPFVLPDEVAAVRLVQDRKKFARGHLETLLETSPARVAAACAHFTRCGGCHYQHIPYEAQLRFKAEILRETLSRLGRVKFEGEIIAHPSPPFGYRNRAQWKVRRLPGEATPSIGYFEAASTALCPVEECPVLSPRLVTAFEAFRALLRGGALGSLLEVEAFADAADEKLLVTVSFTSLEGVSFESTAKTVRDALPGVESLLVHDASRDRFELIGPGFLHTRVGEIEYRVGHLSFFQVNRFLIEDLVGAATAGTSGGMALDLFAGVGLFSVPLLRSFARVVAVEGNPAAARDLDVNFASPAAKGGGTARGINQDVEPYLERNREFPDLVLLDPPRTGLSPKVIQRLAKLAAPEMRYISCDPATLARDLGALSSTYEIAGVDLFDLFPQTFHVESLVRLKRRELRL